MFLFLTKPAIGHSERSATAESSANASEPRTEIPGRRRGSGRCGRRAILPAVQELFRQVGVFVQGGIEEALVGGGMTIRVKGITGED